MNTANHPHQLVNNERVSGLARVYSIDALRGITLFGILLVHTAGLFGFDQSLPPYEFSHLGCSIQSTIGQLLSSRCAPIFSMLFGVSFYLILRKSDYSSGKFAWRCILLVIIGLFNKIFYTYDTLMWYGVWGLVLLSIRRVHNNWILAISILSLLTASFLRNYHLGDLLFQTRLRYVDNFSFSDIISYPLIDAICAYLRVVFNGGIFSSFAYMSFGYWIARKKLMYQIENWATIKNVLLLLFAYILLYKASWYFHSPMLSKLGFTCGAVFMATTFLYLYTKINRRMIFLEAYGRMGLTNYSFQGIIGVCSLTLFLLPNKVDFVGIILYFIGLYIFQCVFSYYWLKYFKFGPMEYLWRSLVNLRFSNPLICSTKNEKC